MLTYKINEESSVNLIDLSDNTLYIAFCAGIPHLLIKYKSSSGIKICTYDLDNGDSDIAEVNHVSFDKIKAIKHIDIILED